MKKSYLILMLSIVPWYTVVKKTMNQHLMLISLLKEKP